jgi:hypothetical protein
VTKTRFDETVNGFIASQKSNLTDLPTQKRDKFAKKAEIRRLRTNKKDRNLAMEVEKTDLSEEQKQESSLIKVKQRLAGLIKVSA